MKKIVPILTILITLALSAIIIIFFEDERVSTYKAPKEVYQVYLGGKKIGVVESKTELEEYIDNKQAEIKEKYNIDKVYPPKALNIQKHISYGEKILDETEVYDIIKEQSPFTIKGWTFTIKSSEESEDKEEKIINVIDYEVFKNAVNKAVESFVNPEEYKLFLEDKQPEIKTTGKIIEDVYVPSDQITEKESFISADEYIFTDEKELAKYLLFGTTEEQQKYKVKEGDTISGIAYNHKLGTSEFMIVNPEFKNHNSLLFPGQEVSVGLINPIVEVVVEEHIVEDQAIKFTTETTYDESLPYGQTKIIQEGSDGIERFVQKRQTKNGVITNVQFDRSATTRIKDPVKQIVVRGIKSSGGGTVIVSSDGNWVWPTNPGYVITSPYAWRGGSFHDAIDISGTGYGSPIYAARDGKVVLVESITTGYGNNIILEHDNNMYTRYAHNRKNLVKEGQKVKAGQIIATMGNTGRVSPLPTLENPTRGTHLHFEVSVGYPHAAGSKTTDPMSLYR